MFSSGSNMRWPECSCPTLWDPVDCSPPGSSVRGISQARVLEWVAIFFSEDLPHPGMELASPASPALAGIFFYPRAYYPVEKAMATRSSVLAWRIPGTGEPGGLPSLGSQSRTRLKPLSSSSSSSCYSGLGIPTSRFPNRLCGALQTNLHIVLPSFQCLPAATRSGQRAFRCGGDSGAAAHQSSRARRPRLPSRASGGGRPARTGGSARQRPGSAAPGRTQVWRSSPAF